MASAEFDEESESKRPTVQVGDPFMEKLLLEACLSCSRPTAWWASRTWAPRAHFLVVEMASRAGSGLELDVDAVPRRETGMTPYEVMLSESQERMLLVAKKGREKEVFDICDKWDLAHAIVGRVTDTGKLVVKSAGRRWRPAHRAAHRRCARLRPAAQAALLAGRGAGCRTFRSPRTWSRR